MEYKSRSRASLDSIKSIKNHPNLIKKLLFNVETSIKFRRKSSEPNLGEKKKPFSLINKRNRINTTSNQIMSENNRRISSEISIVTIKFCNHY